MHFEAMLTWSFIDATVNLSAQTTQNYMSEVNSKTPTRARRPAYARSLCFANPLVGKPGKPLCAVAHSFELFQDIRFNPVTERALERHLRDFVEVHVLVVHAHLA